MIAAKLPDAIVLVEMAYWVCLRRPLDDSGRQFWIERIEQTEFSPSKLIEELLQSPECRVLNRRPGEYVLEAVRRFWSKVVPAAMKVHDHPGEESRGAPEPMELVAMAYWVFLQRPLDEIGRRSWQELMQRREFSPRVLVQVLMKSPEYLMLNRTPFPTMVHLSRLAWIKTLPPAARVLDIGGSSPNIAEGALIELGYPHRPRELVIFDLPPNEQYWGAPRHPQDRTYSFDWGKLSYVHGRCEHISNFPELAEQRFDLVFMGQVIEHIEVAALPNVLRWVYDHLNPGGCFVFDTPNRTLTEIQIPGGFVDPDHKTEYRPHELAALLERCGFRVRKALGLLPMPESLETRQFDPLETYVHPLICDDASQGYLFAMECSI